jgi:RNA polymerase sigma factor (sigma-70 family)
MTTVKVQEDQIPELIRKGEDRKVIPVLYKKVLPMVENFILKNSGRKEDAFDVFQDALMVFYKQVVNKTFDPKYKVYGYLYRISINYWINKIKRDKKIELVEDLHESGFEPLEVKETLVAVNEENILKTVFAGIGEKCIELLTYTIYYNLLMEDVVARMGFPSVSAVKMQQQRCKQKLMQEVEKNPKLMEKLREI